MQFSLRSLLIALLTLFVLMGAVFIFLAAQIFYQNLLNIILEDKVKTVELVGDIIPALSPDNQREALKRIAKSEEVVFFRLVDIPQKEILLSSDEKEEGVILTALPNFEEGAMLNPSAFQQTPIIEITLQTSPERFLWMGLESTFFVDAAVAMATQEGFLVAIMLIILGGALFFTVYFFVIKPLRAIVLACEKIQKGNLNVKLDIKARTEIGELAETFNMTIEDLKKSREALEEAKTSLEIKVAERTKELEALTKTLDAKVKQRTKELQVRLSELEKFHELTVGRELKMIELKKEIEQLKELLNKNTEA